MYDAPSMRLVGYFVAVAEELHFGRAAARLHISAPPLSQRIRELEHALGFRLFERTSRAVSLTEQGQALLPAARALLDAASRFTLVSGDVRATATSVRLAFSHGSEGPAMAAVGAFHVAQPQYAVRADGMTSRRIYESIVAGVLDIGVARRPSPADRRLATVALAGVNVDLIAVPAGDPLAARRRLKVTDLDGRPMLLVDAADSPAVHADTLAFFESHGVRPRFRTMSATQIERALDMVAAGSGYSWLNGWQADAARRRRDVRVVRVAEPARRDEFLVVHRAGEHGAWLATMLDALQRAAAGANAKMHT